MTTQSIKRNLLVWLLLPLLTLLAVVGGNAYFTGLDISNDVYDRALYDSVLTLGILVKSDDGHVSVDLPPVARRMLEVDPMDNIYYSVKSTAGETILGDPDLPMGSAASSPVETPVFFYSAHHGAAIRVAAARIVPQGEDAPPVVVVVAETLKKRQSMASQILRQSIAPQLLFLVIAVALVWFAVQRALRPLTQISVLVNRRSALDFEPLPEASVPLEIRSLTTAFNKLMQRFEASFTLQKRFVGNAAHQLRTPVAGMRAIIEAELLGQAPAARSPTLTRLQRSALRMSRLVQQLLSLSRAEPGNPQRLTPQDMGRLVLAVIDEYEVFAAERDVELQADVAEGVRVLGDALMLSEMIGNLIDNAIRYSPGQSTVWVSLSRDGTEARLRIADAGPGVSEAEAERIFERFYRGEQATQEGSGLGLAIVKEIADAHGAIVSIGPRAEGPGALVLVVLQALA